MPYKEDPHVKVRIEQDNRYLRVYFERKINEEVKNGKHPEYSDGDIITIKNRIWGKLIGAIKMARSLYSPFVAEYGPDGDNGTQIYLQVSKDSITELRALLNTITKLWNSENKLPQRLIAFNSLSNIFDKIYSFQEKLTSEANSRNDKIEILNDIAAQIGFKYCITENCHNNALAFINKSKIIKDDTPLHMLEAWINEGKKVLNAVRVEHQAKVIQEQMEKINLLIKYFSIQHNAPSNELDNIDKYIRLLEEYDKKHGENLKVKNFSTTSEVSGWLSTINEQEINKLVSEGDKFFDIIYEHEMEVAQTLKSDFITLNNKLTDLGADVTDSDNIHVLYNDYKQSKKNAEDFYQQIISSNALFIFNLSQYNMMLEQLNKKASVLAEELQKLKSNEEFICEADGTCSQKSDNIYNTGRKILSIDSHDHVFDQAYSPSKNSYNYLFFSNNLKTKALFFTGLTTSALQIREDTSLPSSQSEIYTNKEIHIGLLITLAISSAIICLSLIFYLCKKVGKQDNQANDNHLPKI